MVVYPTYYIHFFSMSQVVVSGFLPSVASIYCVLPPTISVQKDLPLPFLNLNRHLLSSFWDGYRLGGSFPCQIILRFPSVLAN